MNNINVKEMQQVQLGMLKEILKVCKTHKINVFLGYGTALGAIRHKGFIPWDDDIDLMIKIEDREKFREACIQDLPENYFYQCPETDRQYGLAIDRIRRSDTTLIEKSEKDRKINHGIFVDIYPLFPCSDNIVGYFYQRANRFLYRLFLYDRPPVNKNKRVTVVAKAVLKLTPDFIKRRIMKNSEKSIIKHGGEKNLITLYGLDEHVKYKREWFQKTQWVIFEDIEAPVPVGVKEYLTYRYGNYLELPPIEKRNVHHDYYAVDVHKGFNNYLL